MQIPGDETLKEILTPPKRVAIVGLSGKPDRASNEVGGYLKEQGFEIIPVNPGENEVFGIKAVKSLSDIEGHVDIVDVFRGSEHLPEIAEETVKIGADVFWAQLGVSNEEAYDHLKENNVEVVMDRCMLQEHNRLGN
ncbi:CoA-binding protein [Bacillus marinisedimentorum]|uniref:CoA-binding protein n=1 Tax=Bacillus marinisedimentorum TaxID=1821260 RepID=UPI0008730CE5|nr:CoA-binding protein [Bacillus marinisedimentorum]